MANATENAKESVYKSIISPVLVLLVICVACGALLAWLNEQTAPLIKENELLATQAAFLAVLPEGTDANSLSNLETDTEGVESAVRTADGKAAVKAIASGYSGKDVTVYVAFETVSRWMLPPRLPASEARWALPSSARDSWAGMRVPKWRLERL